MVWAFELGLPQSVQVRPVGYTDAEIQPQGEMGYFHFRARGTQPPLKVTWYSGGELWPDRPAALPANFDMSWTERCSSARRGSSSATARAVRRGSSRRPCAPPISRRPRPCPAPRAITATGWMRSRAGRRPAPNFEFGAHLTQIALLGVLSLRTGGNASSGIPRTKRPAACPQADAYIKETYRPGWEVA